MFLQAMLHVKPQFGDYGSMQGWMLQSITNDRSELVDLSGSAQLQTMYACTGDCSIASLCTMLMMHAGLLTHGHILGMQDVLKTRQHL